MEHWQAISVDEQLTKEAAEKRQDVPHGGIADCCAAQGLPAIQLGGDVIVRGGVADEDVKVVLGL